MRTRSSVVIIACLMLALVGTMGVVVRAPAANAAIPAPADLFTRGMGGYDCFRGPRLVTTNEGTIVAIATGKYYVAGKCEDFSSSHIVARRSFDGGRTWSALQKVREGSDGLNASPVVDRATGDIYLLGRRDTTPTNTDDTSRAFILVSRNDGLTWVDGPAYPDWSLRPGPSHGIQLERGPHPGRLVFAVWTSPSSGHRVRLVYKDPGETQWHLGAFSDPSGEWAGEPSLFERNDGTIYVMARKNIGDGDLGEFRTYGTSADGGATFTGPFQVVDNLIGPKVYGALLPLKSTLDGDRYNRVLFSAPADYRTRTGSSVKDRHDMVIRSSYNEGRTWDSVSEGKLIYRGPASYSGMTETEDGAVVLAFEAGNDGQVSHEEIRVTRVSEEDLGLPDNYTGGVASPDVSGMDNTARIRGGTAHDGDGRFDGGVTLDGADDHVQVPFAESLAVNGGDFTVMAWIKYTATSGNHPIFWAYNVGDQYSQTWLRAEPGSNRIHGRIQSGDNGGSVMSSTAYNDGAWHHVAFQRQGTTLRLFVDGRPDGVATAPTGTVSPARPFTMNFGRRLDGAQHFAGSLDEARLYKKALSSTEISRIRDTNAIDIPGAVLRLPFHPNFPTTPDVSANGNTSFVHGGALLATGRYGDAMTFDGTGDWVHVPFSNASNVGSAPFTITTWFKYTGADALQTLLWGYGINEANPQLWVRADPANNKIVTRARTVNGTATIETAGDYGDNAWHFLALRRTATGLVLTIDGTMVGTAALSGSLTADQAEGIEGFNLGRKLSTDADYFSGSLDEVRVHLRALSDTELEAIRTSNTTPADGLSMHLPFNTKQPAQP